MRRGGLRLMARRYWMAPARRHSSGQHTPRQAQRGLRFTSPPPPRRIRGPFPISNQGKPGAATSRGAARGFPNSGRRGGLGRQSTGVNYEAVIFDLGGVVLGSPLHAIARYERDGGFPQGFINRVVVESGRQGAWSRLERGELEMDAFCIAPQVFCVQLPVLCALTRDRRQGREGNRHS